MHPELKNKPLEYFQRKAVAQEHQQSLLKRHTKINDQLLKASFEIALLIAKTKKPHTIAENLILPAAIKICETVHGDEIAKSLKSIPCSNDTIKRRIESMADNIKVLLLNRIKTSRCFSIQLDESTDNTNSAQLICFIRYPYDIHILDDLLFCTELQKTTKGKDIFEKVNEFFSNNKLKWSMCMGVCTDGAAAMTGRISGFIAEVKKVCPLVKHVHCVIHREHLVFRKMCCELSEILNNVSAIVNLVKNRALNSRLFKILCSEMGSEHEILLYHTEVRWLSRDKVLNRVAELSDELRIFLRDVKPEYSTFFYDEKWMCLLSYLADFFNKVNELNLSLQGKNTNILILNVKIQAFKEKLNAWSKAIEKGSTEMFACLNEFLVRNELSLSTQIKAILINHMSEVQSFFGKFFPDINENNIYDWVRNPFAKTIKYDHLDWPAQEELIEVRSDNALEMWCSRKKVLKNFC